MFSLRNILARNILKMGKPIKLTTPGGIVKTRSKKTNTSRTFASALPRMSVQPAREPPPPQLSEAIPENTMTFSDLGKENLLNPILLKTIIEDLKFDHMMPVQSATLHDLLEKRVDILAQAKTGTGKTMAFLLPAIQTLLNKDRKPGSAISLLVITPTRELALQIAKEATSLLRRIPQYKIAVAIGGTNKTTEERNILKGCDILIATPGRLNDHLLNQDILARFRSLDTLVLDEADRLLDMGFTRDIEQIVRSLPHKKQTGRQGMLFSATIAPRVQQCAHLVLSDGYKTVCTIPEGESNTHDRVPQLLVTVPAFKDVAPAMVGSLLSEIKLLPSGLNEFKAVIFAPTAALVDWYEAILSNIQGLPKVECIHSRHTQSKRTRTATWFREAKSGIIVATDVIARGMDFPGVTSVIQVGVPADKESYIHRLGRTARAGAEGRGVFIITQSESFFSRKILKEITFINTEADMSSANEVYQAARSYESKGKVYQAWLGYYKNHVKPMNWDLRQLVEQGNTFSREALGCEEVPGLQKSTVGKMGLKGVPGLTITKDEPRQGGGGGGRGGGRGGRA